MPKSTKDMIEDAMPGFTLDEDPAVNVADAQSLVPDSEFVAKPMPAVKRLYGFESDAAAAAPSKAAKPQATLVSAKSVIEQDDPALGRRTAILSGGKIVGIQG